MKFENKPSTTSSESFDVGVTEPASWVEGSSLQDWQMRAKFCFAHMQQVWTIPVEEYVGGESSFENTDD